MDLLNVNFLELYLAVSFFQLAIISTQIFIPRCKNIPIEYENKSPEYEFLGIVSSYFFPTKHNTMRKLKISFAKANSRNFPKMNINEI